MRRGATSNFASGSWQELVHDVYIGTITGASHFPYFLKTWTVEYILLPFLQITRLSSVLFPSLVQDQQAISDQSQSHQPKDLKVVGIGFGRTGTYSLTLALEELGYPTLHTQHLYENKDIQQMWSDLIFNPSLAKGRAELGTPDFDVITRHGYEATTDFPMALYYDQIHERYPDCKFILTTRDNSEKWFKSWDTLTKTITAPTYYGGWFISGVRHYSVYLRWLFAVVNKDDSFLTSNRPKMLQYKQAAVDSYETHNQRVRELIPSHQLLDYSVKQGWQPICDFLEIADCPTTPFPKTNSARSVQVQAVSGALVPLILVLFCVFTLFTRVFQFATGMTPLSWLQFQRDVALPRMVNRVFLNAKHPQDHHEHSVSKAGKVKSS
uniref:Sulfotransferase domain-containing protein n=1 Tax=Craspedostauros australis TaxID=1486917 RepID=A0A6T6FWA0_9STRA